MATLISVYNSDGCVGRCDAKCYDATHPGCDCVCGGKNHGAGEKKAIENTREYCESMIENYIKEHQVKDGRGQVESGAAQFKLF